MPVIEIATLEAYTDATILKPYPKTQAQEGPNCGFYALSIVMKYWHERGEAKAPLPARKRDDPTGQATRSLRQIGKEVGALDLENGVKASFGGVFTAEQLANVAKAEEFDARVFSLTTHENFQKGIYTAIDRGCPVILAFDQKEGNPFELEGAHAHWGIVFGYRKNPLTFIATHGHGKYYEWPQYDLTKSNFGLDQRTHTQLPGGKIMISARLTRNGTEVLNTKTGFVEGALQKEDFIRTIMRDSRPAWKTLAEMKELQESLPRVKTLLKQTKGLDGEFQMLKTEPAQKRVETYQSKMDLAKKIIIVKPKAG